RHCLQQFQVGQPFQLVQVGHLGEKAGVRIVQPIDEKLENVAEHGLSGGKDQEAENTQHEKGDVGLYVAEQAKVNLQAGRLASAGLMIWHASTYQRLKKAREITIQLRLRHLTVVLYHAGAAAIAE